VQSIINLVGGETPTEDDVEDLFNLLDVNGDGTIDRTEFTSLLTTFFKLLREHHINVEIGEETDIVL
jgi:Ca2+-binding EF-hand superfamily protein